MNATNGLQDGRLTQVQDYYGKTLAGKDDLVTNVCTVDEPPPYRNSPRRGGNLRASCDGSSPR